MARNVILRIIRRWVRQVINTFVVVRDCGQHNVINVKTKKYRGLLNITVFGNNNYIEISDTCVFAGVDIVVHGDNNCLVMEYDSKMQAGHIILQDGAKIHIGHNATFQEVHIVMKNGICTIGADCMFSYEIVMRNYDGHKIVDLQTNQIRNSPGNITIGDHVWVGQRVTILKNAEIANGAIIGCNAVVSGTIDSESIAVGIPAKVIRKRVSWIRH